MKLQLIRKQIEIGDIVSFVFEPLAKLEWQAGQYMRWTVMVKGEPQDHWFTIASPPYTEQPMLTTRMRIHSSYKQALDQLAPGDNIDAAAVGGDFVWEDSDQPPIFIAGGIGVTPFRSMLLQRAHEELPLRATLVHIVTENGTLYEEVFDQLALTHPEFRLTRMPAPLTDMETFKKTLPELLSSTIYISGTEYMVDTVTIALRALGVPDHHLKRDRFKGYNDSA